jgi:hypothetical protein
MATKRSTKKSKKGTAPTPKKKITEFVRKIQHQANGSTTVAIPPEMFRDLKWRDKQKVVVKKRGDTIVITDWKPQKKK